MCTPQGGDLTAVRGIAHFTQTQANRQSYCESINRAIPQDRGLLTFCVLPFPVLIEQYKY